MPGDAAPSGRCRAPVARRLGAVARNGIRSAPLHNALFALFLGGILAYGAAFAWYMLDRFDLYDLLRTALDDAFYYFQTAWHMAGGNFSTFDGGISRTNGYHPLWMFLITPFYWMFDKVEALYAIKAFEIMLVAGGVALVAGAARAARLPWILLFGALPTVYKYIGTLNAGSEAAAGLFMLGALFLTVSLYARDPAKWRLALAVVAFALPWVRLEYGAISLAATGALCLLEWSWRDPSTRGALALLRVRAGVPFLAAGGGLLVYFVYNAVVFGGALPVSAAVKRWWSERAFESEGGYSLARNFDAMLQSRYFDDEVPIALVLCGLLALVWWCARRKHAREDWLLLAFLVGVFSLAVGHLAKFAQSVLTVHPRFWFVWLVFRPGLSHEGPGRSDPVLCRPLSHPPVPRAGTRLGSKARVPGSAGMDIPRRDVLPVREGGLRSPVQVRRFDDRGRPGQQPPHPFLFRHHGHEPPVARGQRRRFLECRHHRVLLPLPGGKPGWADQLLRLAASPQGGNRRHVSHTVRSQPYGRDQSLRGPRTPAAVRERVD